MEAMEASGMSRRGCLAMAAVAVFGAGVRVDNEQLIELDAIISLAKDGGDPREIHARLSAIRDYIAWAIGVADPRD